jgi:IstB-like ATP binding protein
VATNAPFSEWGQTFTDPRLAAAVVDRLTFNAVILETGTDSYRLRATRTKPTGPINDQPGRHQPAGATPTTADKEASTTC